MQFVLCGIPTTGVISDVEGIHRYELSEAMTHGIIVWTGSQFLWFSDGLFQQEFVYSRLGHDHFFVNPEGAVSIKVSSFLGKDEFLAIRTLAGTTYTHWGLVTYFQLP